MFCVVINEPVDQAGIFQVTGQAAQVEVFLRWQLLCNDNLYVKCLYTDMIYPRAYFFNC